MVLLSTEVSKAVVGDALKCNQGINTSASLTRCMAIHNICYSASLVFTNSNGTVIESMESRDCGRIKRKCGEICTGIKRVIEQFSVATYLSACKIWCCNTDLCNEDLLQLTPAKSL